MKKKADRSAIQAEARLMLEDIKRRRSVLTETVGIFFRKRRQIPAYRRLARLTVGDVRRLDTDAAALQKEAGL